MQQTIEVSLPDVECEHCTLQVIQVMYDKKPISVGGNDIYYHCADIALVRDASETDLGPPADGGGTAGGDGAVGADGADGACWWLLSLAALRRRGGSSPRGPSGSARASGRGRA